MIRQQRRRHLVLWLVIGPVILAGFALGLSVRRTPPVEDAKPSQDTGVIRAAADEAAEVSP